MPELYVEMVDSFHQFIPPTEGVYVSQSLLIARRQLIIRLDECQRPGHHEENCCAAEWPYFRWPAIE